MFFLTNILYTEHMTHFIRGRKNTPEKQQFAYELRRKMTPSEQKLWKYLKADRLDNLHFRRQHVIQGFIVDFYCHQAQLVIEVDGSVHRKQQEYDRERSRVLEDLGLHVIRFSNQQIQQDFDAVLESISQTCCSRLDSSGTFTPFPPREGGEVE